MQFLEELKKVYYIYMCMLLLEVVIQLFFFFFLKIIIQFFLITLPFQLGQLNIRRSHRLEVGAM